MTERPTHDRVIVQLDSLEKEAKNVSNGGIILPASAIKGNTQFATVLAVGNGLYTQSGILIPMSVKVGDRVRISTFGDIQNISDDTLIIRDSDILTIL